MLKTAEIWPTLPTRMLPMLRKLLSTFVSIQRKNRLLRLSLTEHEVNVEETSQPRLVQIIGRECYSEQHKQYPALSTSALKAVLDHEFTGQSVLHQIGTLQNGQQEVTSYLLSPQLVKNLRSGFWLPESLLLGMALPGQVISIEHDGQKFFCCNWNGLNYSALQTPICSDPHRFKMVQGLPADLPLKQLDQAQHQALLVRGLTSLPVQTFVGFWRLKESAVQLDWRAIMLTCLISWSLYLAAVSGWLHWQEAQIQSQTDVMGPKINELLDLQKRYDLSVALQQEIADSLQQAVYPEQLSLLMLELTSQQVVVERLLLKSGMVELTLRAAKATTALTSIQQMPFVSSANYVNATRRVDDFEQFTVSVQFKSGAAADDK